MNKNDLFDLLFKNSRFTIEYDGEQLEKVVNGDSIYFIDKGTDETMVHIRNGRIFCTECDCELNKRDCESVNDHTIKLVCQDCLYEYKVTFVNPNSIPLGKEVKSLMDGSTYVIKVADETFHALYTEGQFKCIERSGELVKPDLVEREVFLTNSQLCELRD